MGGFYKRLYSQEQVEEDQPQANEEIFAKMMKSRMIQFLPNWIKPTQTTFVKRMLYF